jgi:hypothetical protein
MKDGAAGVMRVTERGEIAFLYRPRVERRRVAGLADVQRLYLVLCPPPPYRCRRIVVGRKRLPAARGGAERFWGHVERVGATLEEVVEDLAATTYTTRTRGKRYQPGPRLAGHGAYALAVHEAHTHLVYALTSPPPDGPLPAELNIASEASFIVAVFNPAPPGVDGPPVETSPFPPELDARFQGRRFSPVDPPEFLDHEGAELVLIAAGESAPAELDLALEPDGEAEATTDLAGELRRAGPGRGEPR